MEGLFQLFFVLSGFCSYTGGTLRDYVLIQEQKTWDEAQAYCREKHTELATVQSNEDSANLREAVYKMTNMAWIGLYNDINSWRWSYQDEKITFQSWYAGEPNNYGNEECGVIYGSTWQDWGCTALFPFVCYNENGINRFVFNNFSITWKEAQNYCRQHYTDLAIIQNQTESNQVTVVTQGAGAWIGLFRDAWKWSDHTTNASTSFITWMTGQPDMDGLQRPCGVSDSSGLFNDQFCSNVLPFLCLDRRTKQQIVRVKVKSGQNLNDPEVMEVILQWIKQKLKEQGIEKDTRVAWNFQPNGNVFHKIENKP